MKYRFLYYSNFQINLLIIFRVNYLFQHFINEGVLSEKKKRIEINTLTDCYIYMIEKKIKIYQNNL